MKRLLVAGSAAGIALTFLPAAPLGAWQPAPAAAAPAAHHYVSGDFDGDGKPDIAVGAPGRAQVRVSYTSAHPDHSHVAWIEPAETSAEPSSFGQTLALGDFNGDGWADLAVGAPDFRDPNQHSSFEDNPEPQGAIYVFFGSATGLQEAQQIEGPYDGDEPYNLGEQIAAGDVNGDGYTDLAATIYGDDYGLRYIPGSSSGLDTGGTQELDAYSTTAVAFGDVNGDGYGDLLAGDPEGNVLTVFPGGADGVTGDGSYQVHGGDLGVQGLGSDVASGDINGDSYPDAVLGAAAGNRVVVLFGRSHRLRAGHSDVLREHAVDPGAATSDGFGSAVSVRAVNGDRYADVTVGAPGTTVSHKAGAGAVWLIRGGKHGLAAAHAQRITEKGGKVPGTPQTHGGFGASLRLGPVDTDNHADLLVGAPNASQGARHGGFYVRLSGAKSGLSTKHAKGVGGTTDTAYLGTALV
jgi:hypothetical protein